MTPHVWPVEARSRLLQHALTCPPAHSALSLAARITFVHYSTSIANCAANSCGVLPTGSKPSARSRSFKSGRAMIWAISRCSRAILAHDGQRAQQSTLDLRRGCRQRGKSNWRVACDRRRDGRPAAPKGNMHEVEASRDSELLAQKVRGRSKSRRGEAVLARIGL